MRERVRNKHKQAQGIWLTELAAVLREHSERSPVSAQRRAYSSTHIRCEQHLQVSRKGRGRATTHVARLAAAATAAAAAAAARLRVRAVAGDVSCKKQRG